MYRTTKPTLLVLFYLLFLSVSQLAAQTDLLAEANHSKQAFVPDKVMMRIKPDWRSLCGDQAINIPDLISKLNQSQVRRLSKAFPHTPAPEENFNAKGQRLADLSLIYELDLHPGSDVRQAVQTLMEHEAVLYAEPLYVYETLYKPNDVWYHKQWFLDTCHFQQAWNIEKGNANVLIGIIDTGTEFEHPELSFKHHLNLLDTIDGIDNDKDGYVDNYRGWDFANKDNDPSWKGCHGCDHGVMVAGQAVCHSDNKTKLAGAGFNTRFVPLKASMDGSLGIAYGFHAITYAADHNIPILNLSWGGRGYSQFGQDVVNYAAINRGCLIVAAAGNEHRNTYYYPASYDNVMSIGANGKADKIWNFNNNRRTGSTYNNKIAITAPGAFLPMLGGGKSVINVGYGTSLSSPLVCGAAALLKARYPAFHYTQIRELLRVSAENNYGVNNKPEYKFNLGHGQLDIGTAMQYNGPAVRLDSFRVEARFDDIPESFDTVAVFPSFTNFLWATSQLRIRVQSLDTSLLQVLNGGFTVGTLSMGQALHPTRAFKFQVMKSLDKNTSIQVLVTYEDGPYKDWQIIQLNLQPKSLPVAINDLKTATSDNGTIGNFFQFPSHLGWGEGLHYQGGANLVYDLGLMVGNNQNAISDRVGWGTVLKGNQDFRGLKAPRVQYSQGGKALLVETYFTDRGKAKNPYNLDITQRLRGWNDAGHKNYLLLEYELFNTTRDTIPQLLAGLYGDWTLGYTLEMGQYDPNHNMIYAWSGDTSIKTYVGLVCVSHQQGQANNLNGHAIWGNDREKWHAMRRTTTASFGPGMVIQTIAAPAFDLAPGQRDTVAYALVVGYSPQDLVTAAQNARKRYQCEVLKRLPAIPVLGADRNICPGTQVIMDAGKGQHQYLWSDGSKAQSLKVSQAGTWAVTVTNQQGCQASDAVTLGYHPLPDLISRTPAAICEGDMVQLTAKGGTSYAWSPKRWLDQPNAAQTMANPPQSQWYHVSALTPQGCKVSDSVYVEVISSKHFSYTYTLQGNRATFQVPAVKDQVLTWDFGDGSSSHQTNPTHSWRLPGRYKVCLTALHPNGCIRSHCKTIWVLKAAHRGLSVTTRLSLAPNPNKGHFQVSLEQGPDGTGEMTLTDMQGAVHFRKAIRIKDGRLNESLALPTLPRGLYILTLSSGDWCQIHKVSIIR